MDFLYNYGISQEDIITEIKALDLKNGDSLLCIASAGEIPLNAAAILDVTITAADISANQLRLCRMKQTAASLLDSMDAAAYLGYMKMTCKDREKIYKDYISLILSEEDRRFWVQNLNAIKNGVINEGRFEKYIKKVSVLGQLIIGKRNLIRLLECDSVEEQQYVFDRHIKGPLLKAIFKIAFHPVIYKNRGIDPSGLTHSGVRNISDFFFRRFRNFCCNTLSSKNYLFQYTFFSRVLYPVALPEYLQPSRKDQFIRNSPQIVYELSPVERILSQSSPGRFNKIHLSNIGDWLSQEDMNKIFYLIQEKTQPSAKAILRYIHLRHSLPRSATELTVDYQSGEKIMLMDRYPFYSAAIINHLDHEQILY